MRNLTKATLPVAMTAALAFALTPRAAHAQQAAEHAAKSKACTAQVVPASVEAGQKAVQVQVKLSDKVGTIAKVAGDEIQLASIADLPKAEMSRTEKAETAEKAESAEKSEKAEKQENDAPKVVEMAAEGTSATLWLDTQKAKAGKQHVTLEGENGTCTASLEVTSGTKKDKK